MGRQIRFFMGPQDEAKFLKFVRANGDRIVRTKTKDGKVDFISGELLDTDLTVLIVSDSSRIVIDEYGFIDLSRSDVIEFSRCSKVKDGRMEEYGRLWFETEYWDDQQQLIRKEEWLKKRFELYRKWIKKNFRISKDKDFYIGEEAYQLYLNGVKMMAGPKCAVEF